jgi:hypothetical protein
VGTAIIGIGSLLLVGEVFSHVFSQDLARLFPVLFAVLSQRVLLLSDGLEVEKYYPRQYTSDVSLGAALGDETDRRLLLRAGSDEVTRERVHLGAKLEELHMKAMEGGVENRIARAEDILVNQVTPDAVALVQAAKQNEQLASAGSELAAKAQTLIQQSAAVDLAREMVSVPEQRLDASEVINTGTAVVLSTVGTVVGDLKQKDEAELAQLKDRAWSVLDEAKAVVATSESELAKQLVGRGQELFTAVVEGGDAPGDGPPGEDAALGAQVKASVQKGRALIGDAQTPEEMMQKLKEDEAFVSELKVLCIRYVEQTITSVELPTVHGSRDWGTYSAHGLAVRSLAVSPEMLYVDVTDSVSCAMSRNRLVIVFYCRTSFMPRRTDYYSHARRFHRV